MLKLGCHVGMSGKEMMLGSVKDAVLFGANTFCFIPVLLRIRGEKKYQN